MKNFVKVILASAVIGAMAVFSTGCLGIPGLSGFGGRNAEYMEEMDDLIEDCMNFRTKKVAKYLNEDDKNFDNNEDILETAMGNLPSYIDFDDFIEDVKCDSRHMKSVADEYTFTYVFEFDHEEFEFEFTMILDDGEFCFEDNEDFIRAYLELVLNLAYQNGDQYVEDCMDELDCSISKLPDRMYEELDWLLGM